jgi:hypothetical protein
MDLVKPSEDGAVALLVEAVPAFLGLLGFIPWRGI